MTKRLVRWDYANPKDPYVVCRKCHIKFLYSRHGMFNRDMAIEIRNQHESTCNGTKPDLQKDILMQQGINFNE